MKHTRRALCAASSTVLFNVTKPVFVTWGYLRYVYWRDELAGFWASIGVTYDVTVTGGKGMPRWLLH